MFQYFNRKHIFLAFQCKLCLHFPTPATLFPPPHTTGGSAHTVYAGREAENKRGELPEEREMSLSLEAEKTDS